MRLLSVVVVFFVLTGLSSACNAQIFDNPFSEYLERGITITPGAGNAKDANAAIHTIDPWPPYVGYTRIPGDGRRAVNSIEQMYRTPNPFQSQQPSLGSGSPSFGAAPVTGTGTTTNTGGTPMQPISGGY